MIFPFGIKQDGAAQQLRRLGQRGLPGGDVLLSQIIGNPCQISQGCIPCGIQKYIRFHGYMLLRALLIASDGYHPIFLQNNLGDFRIQQQLQLRLRQHRVQQHLIPENRIAFPVAVEVGQLQLPPDSHFLTVEITRSHSTPGPDPDLAAGVSAQYRAIVYQHSLNAASRSRQSTADTGRTAADNRKLCFDPIHDFTLLPKHTSFKS